MAEAILTLQGVRVHVGFYRRGGLYRVDEGDCYVMDAAGNLVVEIEDVDKLGCYVAGQSWLSLRTLAEMHADDHAADWDRAEHRAAEIDAVIARRVAAA